MTRWFAVPAHTRSWFSRCAACYVLIYLVLACRGDHMATGIISRSHSPTKSPFAEGNLRALLRR